MSSFHRVVTKALEANKTSESIQETEEKFATLSLAFKTDRQTLDKRLELHLRARDVAENNIQKELQAVKESIKALSRFCVDQAGHDVLANAQRHVDVLDQSISRMSSQAELHGAVQQEMRISQAVDVMILHVENLKRTYQKEHAELEEARKQMMQSRHGNDSDSSRSHPVGQSFSKVSRRRASIAVISKTPLLLTKNSSSSSAQTLEDNASSSRLHRNSTLDSLLLSENKNSSDSANFSAGLSSSRSNMRQSRPLVRHCSSSAIERSSSLSSSRNNSSSSVVSNSNDNNNNNNDNNNPSAASAAATADDDDDGGDIAAEWAAFRRRQESRSGAAVGSSGTGGVIEFNVPGGGGGSSDASRHEPLVPSATIGPLSSSVGGDRMAGGGAGLAGIVAMATARKPVRMNSSTANSLARVVERISDEEEQEEEEDLDPETVDLQAARRRLLRLMSRSHSIVKHSDGRLQRLASKLVALLPVVWRRTIADRLHVDDSNPLVKRLRQVDASFIRQVALVVAAVLAASLLVYGAYFVFARVAFRFSSRSDQ